MRVNKTMYLDVRVWDGRMSTAIWMRFISCDEEFRNQYRTFKVGRGVWESSR